jgi:hypothetical protein
MPDAPEPAERGSVRRASTVLTAITLAVVLAAAGILPAAAAAAPPNYSAPPVICAPFWHRVVVGKYVVRNDNFGGRRECLSTDGPGTAFAVVSSTSPRVDRVIAFPSIFRGCTHGVCSPRSGFPIRASHLNRAVSSWRIHTRRVKGTWNAAYDLWFFTHHNVSGQATGAELMIWLGHQGLGGVLRRTPVLRIDGARWYLMHWRAAQVISGHRLSWNYIQFRRVTQTEHVNHLRLYPFVRAAEAHGLVRSSWWNSAIMAGFEIWSGGKGLATESFRASVR